jgi:hypothetical protein
MDQTEWDFRHVPQHQLPFCLVYEYARASQESLEQVAEWRTNDSWPEALGFEEGFWMRGLPRVLFLRNFPEFPQRPWQKIPNWKRNQRIDALPDYDPPVVKVPVAALRDGGNYLDIVRRSTPREKSTILPIKINWAFSDDRLGKEFWKWVQRHREEFGFPADIRHAPTTHLEQLKKLAAYRLLQEFRPARAITYTQSFLQPDALAGDPGGLYGTERALRRAAQEAESLLTRRPCPSLPPDIMDILDVIGFATLTQSVKDGVIHYLTTADAQHIARILELPRQRWFRTLEMAISALP